MMLAASVGLSDAAEYRTHDLRRGHALDLQLSGAFCPGHGPAECRCACTLSGAPLGEILAAGDWKSPAFLDYLDKYRLERDLVMQVIE